MIYYVFEAKNIGTPGRPEIVENIVYSSEYIEDACIYADKLRKSYKDTTIINCYIKSDEEIKKEKEAMSFYNSLTEEQKNDIIEVNGKKYIRAIFEKNNK